MKRFLAFLSRLLAKAAGIIIEIPPVVQQWQDFLGIRNILRAITYAAKIAELSDAARQALAREYLQSLAEKMIKGGVPPGTLHELSDSTANLLIELAFAQWKALTKK